MVKESPLSFIPFLRAGLVNSQKKLRAEFWIGLANRDNKQNEYHQSCPVIARILSAREENEREAKRKGKIPQFHIQEASQEGLRSQSQGISLTATPALGSKTRGTSHQVYQFPREAEVP